MISPAQIRRRSGARLLAAVLIAGVLALSMAGCFGQFPLTHMVYEVNGDITDNELGQTLIMWVFLILPVYWFAMVGDALIFNLIEFWTGEAPLQAGVMTDGPYQTAVAVSDDGATLTMTVTREGALVAELSSVQIAPGTFEMRDAQGTVVGLVHHSDAGDLQLCDADGDVLRTLSASQIAGFQASQAL